MKLDFSVEETVKARSSIRTYEEQGITAEEKAKIDAYIHALSNPFGADISFCFLETGEASNGEKLGTYGTIKGARNFIGVAAADEEFALEAVGYSFEKLILYAASLGLGTCWLGGTFQRSQFASAMGFQDKELFPAISPIGHPFGKKRLRDSVVRWAAKSDQRKSWKEIFYKGDFSHPLTEADAGAYAFPLEMLRLAPSAVNKQPWQIVQGENCYHFYEAKTLSEEKFDIQRVDIGIAACHFHLAAMERDLSGRFEKLSTPELPAPDSLHYIFSWIVE